MEIESISDTGIVHLNFTKAMDVFYDYEMLETQEALSFQVENSDFSDRPQVIEWSVIEFNSTTLLI